jgi:hypothetical protein
VALQAPPADAEAATQAQAEKADGEKTDLTIFVLISLFAGPKQKPRERGLDGSALRVRGWGAGLPSKSLTRPAVLSSSVGCPNSDSTKFRIRTGCQQSDIGPLTSGLIRSAGVAAM